MQFNGSRPTPGTRCVKEMKENTEDDISASSQYL